MTREELRIVVILLKALRSLLQRNETGRGENADLSHTAAQHFANAAASFDKFPRTDDHRADRRAQTLAEAELNRVELLRHFGNIFVQICGGIKHPRTVEMHGNPGLVSFIADLIRNACAVDGSSS